MSTGHRVTIEFEAGYGPTLKLICPGGEACSPGWCCAGCGRDVHADRETKPCYDCVGPPPTECAVKTWADNLTADELLAGTLTVDVEVDWSDGEGPVLTVLQPEPALSPRQEADRG